MLYEVITVEEALDLIAVEVEDSPEVKIFMDFIKQSERGIAR